MSNHDDFILEPARPKRGLDWLLLATAAGLVYCAYRFASEARSVRDSTEADVRNLRDEYARLEVERAHLHASLQELRAQVETRAPESAASLGALIETLAPNPLSALDAPAVAASLGALPEVVPESAALESATVESATVESAAVEGAAPDSPPVSVVVPAESRAVANFETGATAPNAATSRNNGASKSKRPRRPPFKTGDAGEIKNVEAPKRKAKTKSKLSDSGSGTPQDDSPGEV